MATSTGLPSVQERIESLKAAAIGAVALGVGFWAMASLHQLIGTVLTAVGTGAHDGQRSPLHFMLAAVDWAEVSALLPPIAWSEPTWWIHGAIAGLSGSLFGITYRYIIRSDNNPHLKTGAVGAFGLVRGLAMVDVGVALQSNGWLLLILVGESMVLFAIAQLALDFAMSIGGFKPLDLTESRAKR